MRRWGSPTARRVAVTATAGLVLLCLAQVVMGGNIDPDDKWAWATDAGWINFSPVCDGCEGVTVLSDHLEGYAWGENIGWIRLGTDNGGAPYPYRNTSAANYGVNIDPAGDLYGYAWGTNVGWIKFDPSEGGVSINRPGGSFDGYAWAENVGWIHFKNLDPAYNVVAYNVGAAGNCVYLPLALRSYPPPPTPTPTSEPVGVTNGGLETGDFTGWIHGGTIPSSVQDDVRHEGTFAAVLGEVADPQLTLAGSAWMVQEVVLPSTGGPYNLSFWYRLVTYDRVDTAHFQMELRDSEGSILERPVKLGYTGIVPPTWGEDFGWKHRTVNLSGYQGRTIRLRFETKQAYLGQGTWTFVDDVRVE